MTEPQSGTGQDVVDILTADHREMVELVEKIKATPEPEQRRDLSDTVTAEVMRHAVAEEMYVYPVIEEHIPDGSAEVEHDKREHAELVDTMKEMEGADTSDPTFLALAQRLEDQLRHHASDEEDDHFPKLRTHISADRLVEIGQQVEAAKKMAPTRPHPHAPHSELFHKLVGPGVGMVDRLRDKLMGRETG